MKKIAGMMGALLLPVSAIAAEPASGTLTDSSGPLTYTAGPFVVPNPSSDLGIAGQEPVCEPMLMNCDIYDLTVALPDDYADKRPDDAVVIEVTWTQIIASPDDIPDFDIYVYDADGNLVSDAGVTSSNPEVIYLPVTNGTRNLQIRTITYTPMGESISASIRLERFDEDKAQGTGLLAGSVGHGFLLLGLAALLRRRRR